MSVLSDIQTAVLGLGIPVETGIFNGKAPSRYMVVTPLADTFDLFADNSPGMDVQEARISLFSQGNYMRDKNRLVKALLDADLTITDRRFIGHETETGYYHYAVDVARSYEFKEA